MDHIQNAKLTFELEIQALEKLKNSIGDDFKKACDIILNNKQGRVIITGMGKSGQIGKKLPQLSLVLELQLSLSILGKLVMVILV